jgi:hypothetical protein
MIILYGFLYRNFCDYCDKCNKMNIKIDLNELYDITFGYFGDIFVWFPEGEAIIRIYDIQKQMHKIR